VARLPTTDYRYSIRRRPGHTLFVDQGDRTVEAEVPQLDERKRPVTGADGAPVMRRVKRRFPNPDGRWRWMVYRHSAGSWLYECSGPPAGFPTRQQALQHARQYFPPPGFWERHGI